MSNRIIITTENGDEQIALNEIKKISPKPKNVSYLAKGITLVELDELYSDFIKKVNNYNLIFIRHIIPIITDAKLTYDNIIEQTLHIVNDNLCFLDKNLKFSIQTRIVNPHITLKPFDINTFISDKLIGSYEMDVKNPEQIISILVCTDTIYIGISLKKDNLSSWPGGNIRFEKKENFISRAEFKLLEAIQTFGLELKGNALDLGAAPGGWTKILSGYCNSVTAVDPAGLHESLYQSPNIIHKKMTAQEFFRSATGKYDVICNDMKMDTNESIDIMANAEKLLSKNNLCIMTLKLPASKQQSRATRSIETLEKYFNILHARKLFHNRNEVTVAFNKKN
ncbi:MAG: methyltransferase domain-containing protein [Clostridiales bacterium]|jgi:23S rRNA (cytidine2498-2'-O)-methyltransferase|nr:methyltransferase domain-containing protein [Clostridiales bacterium]